MEKACPVHPECVRFFHVLGPAFGFHSFYAI
jgi:hypothetical protein